MEFSLTQCAYLVFFTHGPDEKLMGDHKIFVANDDLTHLVVAPFLFSGVGITFPGADIAVKPVQGMECFDFFGHGHRFKHYSFFYSIGFFF